MQGLIIVVTLIALVASLVVIMTRQPAKLQPKPIITQTKQRLLSRPKDRQKRYYQRRIRMIQEQRQHEHDQWLLLIAALSYHHYRREQAILNYN